MKVFLATDHTGFELKEKIKTYLTGKGHTVEDCGAYHKDNNDDYPDFIQKAAAGVASDPQSRGIVIGGSGEGEAIVANKVKGVRCALFYSLATAVGAVDVNGKISEDMFEIVRLSRQHNDANVLSLGARFLKEEDALQAVVIFLETDFSGEERHIRRVEKIKKIENS